MTRAAGVVGLWTVLSRILGFVRDMATASFLGAGPGADAFFVAFRIPNLLRRLFAEGALSAAFVPTFIETLQAKGKAEAMKVAGATITFAVIILALLTGLGIAFSPWVVKIIAPGFLGESAKFDLTVSLNRIMFPYILFISLVALASGVLNSFGHFGAPAAAPTILNITMITAVTGGTYFFGAPAHYALAWGVLAAGLLQLVLQIPFLVAYGIRIYPQWDWRLPELKQIGRLFVPAAFGGAVYQINVLLGTVLASLLPAGGVSWLYYADRLVELPLGVFAIALGTAVLPSMSRQAAQGDLTGLTHSVSFALRIIGFFTIPASVALIILRQPIVALLFQRGLFTVHDTLQTANALLWYTVGLWAFSGLKVVTQAFFSLKDTKTPVLISIIAVIVNVSGGLLLMGPMAQGGLALATSLAAAINLSLLFHLLTKRLGSFPTKEMLVSLGKTIAASGLMGVFLYFAVDFGRWEKGLNQHNLLILSTCISGGLAIFFLSTFILRSSELRSLLRLTTRR